MTLPRICSALRPRRDQCCQAATAARYCPHNHNCKGSRNKDTFEAQSRSFCDHYLRFAAGSPQSTQGSLPAARHALPGRFGYLQGHCERSQRSIFPLFQAYLAQYSLILQLGLCQMIIVVATGYLLVNLL